MSKTKTIYRDIASNRLIPRQDAATRDPDTWVEEIFTPNTSESAGREGKELPYVEHLDS